MIKVRINGQVVPIPTIKGVDGKSAYQYAVEAGYEGTEQEFINLLIEGTDVINNHLTDTTAHDDIRELIESMGRDIENNKVIVDAKINESSTNPVQNKVISSEIVQINERIDNMVTFEVTDGGEPTKENTVLTLNPNSDEVSVYTADEVDEMLSKIPHHIVDYVVAESEEVLNRVVNSQGNRTFNMAVIADLHNVGTSDICVIHACQGVGYISNRFKLDACACLGDHTDSNSNSDWNEYLADIFACNNYKHSLIKNTDYLELVGDQDYMSMHHPVTYKTISAYSTNVVYGNQLGCYFYKDYEDYNLRIICLNTSETARYGVSDEQYEWFINTLDLSDKTNPSKWQILILSHVPIDYKYKFTYILDAYLKGTTWTDGSISCNYTSKNQATIIGNIHGHSHNLIVDKLYLGNYTSGEQIDLYRIAIPEITEDLHNKMLKPYSDSVIYVKSIGDADETAFNILCIDLDNYVIKAICYGWGIDRTVNYNLF